MTKEDILEGKPFTYHGHFRRISHKGFKYIQATNTEIEVFKEWTFNAGTGKMSTVEGDHWWIDELLADKMYAFSTGFGKVPILYKECRLVEGANAA